ncbi:MAG: flippase [Bacteroidota bacterium]
MAVSAKRNYVFNLLYTLSNLLFPLITFPYVTRILLPEGIGKVQFALNFAQGIATIAAHGIPVYGMKEIAVAREKRSRLDAVFSELFWIQAASILVMSALFLIIIWSAPALRGDVEVLQITFFLLIFAILNIDWLYKGLEDFSFTSLRSIFIKAISVVLILVFVKEQEDLLRFAAILTFGYAGNYLLNLTGLRRRVRLIFDFSRLQFKRHLPHLLYILNTILVTTVYTYLDAVFLGLLTDKFEVGIYSVAVRLSKIGVPFVITLAAVLLPRISEASSQKNFREETRLLQTSLSFIFFMSCPIAVGLFLLRAEFILLFAGESFSQAALSLGALSLLPVLIGLGNLFAFQILVPKNLNREMFIAAGSGLVAFFISSIILMPRFGALGAAMSTLITELIVTVLYFALLPGSIRGAFSWKPAYQALISSMVFIPITILVNLLIPNLIVAVATNIGLCAIFYIGLQLLLFKNEFVKMGLTIVGNQITKLKQR